MTDDTESLVPDDVADSTTPEVVVSLDEHASTAPAKTEMVVATIPKDAAEEGVEALARNLEEAKKRAERAEAAKVSAESRAVEAESKITSQEKQNIEANRMAAANAIESNRAKMERAEAEYERLQSEGNYKEALKASKEATRAEMEIERAEGYLKQLEAYTEKLKAEPVKISDPNVDPVTGVKFTPRTLDYVKAQGDNWKDADFRAACDVADRSAKRKGLKPDTDEYFSFLDSQLVTLGYKEAPQQIEEEEPVEEPAPKPRTAPPIAKKPAGASYSPAPTRAVPGSSGVAKKGIKLSGAERDIAQSIVDSLPELFKGQNPDQLYAREKAALIEEVGENYGRNQ